MTTPLDIIEAVARYIEANARRIAGGEWVHDDPTTLRRALAWHALQGNLRVEWNAERGTRNAEVSGVAIVWQDFASEVRRCHRQKKSIFRWLPHLPNGDCLYLSLVIATEAAAVPRLAAWFKQKFPPLPQFAHRRGKLVQFDWLGRISTKNHQLSTQHG